MRFPNFGYTMGKYQDDALRTANMNLPVEIQTATWALGLTGEAGEVADLIKKHLGHGHELDREKLKKELGDVLWYIAALSAHFNLGLEEVARANVAKLERRFPDGFSSEASINRKE